MNTNKIKTWIAEHKGALIVGAGTAVSIGILGYLGVKSYKSTWDVEGVLHGIKDLDISLDKAMVIGALTRRDGGAEMCLTNLRIRDIGELGEDLMKNVPNVTADSAFMCILKIRGES